MQKLVHMCRNWSTCTDTGQHVQILVNIQILVHMCRNRSTCTDTGPRSMYTDTGPHVQTLFHMYRYLSMCTDTGAHSGFHLGGAGGGHSLPPPPCWMFEPPLKFYYIYILYCTACSACPPPGMSKQLFCPPLSKILNAALPLARTDTHDQLHKTTQ